MELSPGLSSEERNLITNSSKQLLEIQQVLGPQKLHRKFQKVWSKEQGKQRAAELFVDPILY